MQTHHGQREPCLCLFRGHDVCATLNYSRHEKFPRSRLTLPPPRVDTEREGKIYTPSQVYFTARALSIRLFPFSFLFFSLLYRDVECETSILTLACQRSATMPLPFIILPTRKSAIAFHRCREKYRSRTYIYIYWTSINPWLLLFSLRLSRESISS